MRERERGGVRERKRERERVKKRERQRERESKRTLDESTCPLVKISVILEHQPHSISLITCLAKFVSFTN